LTENQRLWDRSLLNPNAENKDAFVESGLIDICELKYEKTGQEIFKRIAEELKGKHIIAFEVDFDLIRKNLEDSLKSDVEFDTLLKVVKEGITRAIKEDTRNLYRHILLKEERKPILNQKSDKEDDPKYESFTVNRLWHKY